MAPPRTGQPRRPQANPKAAIGDWLNLVDPDGAFLTTTELNTVFPHGFDSMPPEARTELRARLADLEDDTIARAALRQWLLSDVLDWGDLLAEDQSLPATSLVRVAEHGVSLRPDQGLLEVDDRKKLRVGVFTWPLGTRIDRRTDLVTAGDTWPASPIQRAEAWCRGSGVPLALVTDDDQWALVWAPRGAPAASCRWRIADLADERILQAGLVSLLGARRFFAVDADETLERLFEKAANAEAEITKGLGTSVRRSVELLVAAISRDDVASEGRVLAGVSPTEIYESAVTVLMRLVFLLFAEERRLLPAEDPLWAESYSVLTLRDDLRKTAVRDGDDALERRSTAWHRLLATFRAVHGGANHDRLTLPAYGGSLFDPDRFPFLEGRRAPDHLRVGGVVLGPAEDTEPGPGRPVAIDDRTVLAILDALLTVEVKSGRTKVAQRVSYKALDVEQIGHCYEGLLDHGCAPVEDLAVGLIGPDGGEPEIVLIELEAHIANGPGELCEWLSDKERCAKTATTLAKELARQPDGVGMARLRVACGHNDDTVARVLPFWGLTRSDLRGLPVVLLPGSQFVTQTSTRRNMGAQYTTRALAEEVVQYALEPLVFDPGPQNEADPEKWKLRTPAEILGLRICDPAVGSGAILTAAGRYLADRLIESVTEHGSGEGTFASRLADLADATPEEQIVLARREVVDHCLYGVDKNPVAAEMAKLSLWLTTMARERPFTFLDHAIQVGDSLLGITDLEQLRWLHLDPSRRRGKAGFATLALDQRLQEATGLARRLQAMSVVTVRDAVEKQRLHDELRAKLADLSIVADAVVGAAFSAAGVGGNTPEGRLDPEAERIRVALDDDRPAVERQAALAVLNGLAARWLRADLPGDPPESWARGCLHWPLSFPEVFLSGDRVGFDAMVANPPFLGGKRISSAFGRMYREFVVGYVGGGVKGNADLSAYFLLRMSQISDGFGSLATNTISQGDTREVGIDRLTAGAWSIHRAVKSDPWPGDANLEIAKIWAHSSWSGSRFLGGTKVDQISSALEVQGRVLGNPYRLVGSSGQSFIGSFVNGIGFVLDRDEADRLLQTGSGTPEVIRPYLSGSDVVNDPFSRASRYIIDFSRVSDDVAFSKFPDLVELLEERVRPARRLLKNKPRVSERWWRYEHEAAALYNAISGFKQVLCLAVVSKVVQPAFVDVDQVFMHKVCCFAYDDFAHFGLLASNLHWWWLVRNTSTLETRINYSPTDAFETYPQPRPQLGEAWMHVEEAGQRLHEARSALMAERGIGLTKTYNRVHDPLVTDPGTVLLRDLHVGLDMAMLDAYGWGDIVPDHHHWETPQGIRFTVSSQAKEEMLDRLLELNHERYAEEVAAGLHPTKAARVKGASEERRAHHEDRGQEPML